MSRMRKNNELMAESFFQKYMQEQEQFLKELEYRLVRLNDMEQRSSLLGEFLHGIIANDLFLVEGSEGVNVSFNLKMNIQLEGELVLVSMLIPIKATGELAKVIYESYKKGDLILCAGEIASYVSSKTGEAMGFIQLVDVYEVKYSRLLRSPLVAILDRNKKIIISTTTYRPAI